MGINIDNLGCPFCMSEQLEKISEHIKCSECGKTYNIIDDIPNMRDMNAEFVWGDYQEKIDALLVAAKKIGWHDAFLKFLSNLELKDAISVWNRSYGPRRSALNLMLPLSQNSVVLDYGSGLGNISRGLAQLCKSVISIDQLLSHIKWLNYSAKDENISNINSIVGGGNEHIPLKSSSVDIVILNGVFEWVASNSKGNPKKVQISFMKEVFRVLKPNGLVYVGIENRINYKYFLGQKEGHIKMKYGALLPRWLTNMYLKLTRGVNYREYTYTLAGYKKIFRGAGFSGVNPFSSWPHYGNISYILPLGSSNSSGSSFSSKLLFTKSPFKYFSKSFSLIGLKDGDNKSIIDATIAKIIKGGHVSSQVAITDKTFQMTSTGKAIVHLRDESGQYILKIASNRYAKNSIDNSKIAHSYFRESNFTYFPFTSYGETSGLSFALEKYYHIVQTIDDNTTINVVEKYVENGYDVLYGLAHKYGKCEKIDDALFDKYFRSRIRGLRDWFTFDEWSKYEGIFHSVEESIYSLIIDKNICLIPTHGDFVPNNIVSDKSGKLTTILDWDLFETNDLPMYDLITFLGRVYRAETINRMQESGVETSNVKYHGYPDIFITGKSKSYLDKYMNALDLDHQLFKPLLFMWWVKQLDDWKSLHLYHPEWRKYKVFPLIERALSIFETTS